MENKFQKILIIISSFFAVALIAMGFKIQNDNKQIEQLTTDTVVEPIVDTSQAVVENTDNQNRNQLPVAGTVVLPPPVSTPVKVVAPATPTPAPVVMPAKKTKTS
jgi:hypothetical protein